MKSSWRSWPRHLAGPYAAGAGFAGIILLTLAWWVGRGTPQREATRLAHIQLRMLRQTRDQLTHYLSELDYKVKLLADQPTIEAIDGKITDFASVDRALNRIDLEGLTIRRYGPDGALLLELPTGGSRTPKFSDAKIHEIARWASDPRNAQQTLLDVEGSDRADAGLRDSVRYVAPIWSKGSPPTVYQGFLSVGFSSTNLLSSALLPVHLLPESYTFALAWTPSATKVSAPVMIWHSAEPQWLRSQAQDAQEFIAALGKPPSLLEGGGEDFRILTMPRRDGSQRREVVTMAPLVLGTTRWIIGLVTPYDVAVEFTSAQRYWMLFLTVLMMSILLIGAGLLYYQRQQLLVEAGEQRDRQLQELRHDFQELFAENPTAMLVLNERGEVVECNHSAERLLGCSRQEALQTPVEQHFESDTIHPVLEVLWSRGHLHVRDTQLVRLSDHLPMLLELWGRRIADRWILMAHNVEQRRDLEQQIARLKRVDSMGALASTLAHDFNNLLGQVQILVSHLRTELPADSSMLEDVATIEKKVDDASQLVSNLLDLRESVVSTEPVWLEPLLSEFVIDLRKVLPSNVNLVADIRSDMPSVWVTPHALRRVLDNLVRNACDAMPYGGSISMKAYGKRIPASAASEQLPEDQYAIIEFTDAGVGMSREVLDTIFDPFFTTKRHEKGMGLGLWTVYRVLRRLGGWVHVHSRLGKGTQFTLFFRHGAPKAEDTSPRAVARISASTSYGSSDNLPALPRR